MLAEPMVFDGVVLGPRSHSSRFKFAQSECTNIVFVYFDMKVIVLLYTETTCTSEFSDEIEKRKEILTCCAEGNIFSLHGGESNFCLEFAFPKNRAICNTDDETGATSNAVWILGILFGVETGEVSIRVAVDVK